MNKSKVICCLWLVLIILNSNIIFAFDNSPEEPFFTLELYIHGDPFGRYAPHIIDYLADINIKAVIPIDWMEDIVLIPPIRDLYFLQLTIETKDMRPIFTEDGFLNFFGLDKEIPYYNKSDQLQNQAVLTSDLDARSMYFNDWIKLFTDKILAILPFFGEREYEALWSNTEGYEMRWGLKDSLPYMSYDGQHEGQESTDEFNIITEKMWYGLNPLFSGDSNPVFSRDEERDQIIDLISEPLLTYSPDKSPLKTGLIHDWEQIDDTHYQFFLRDNIFWNPSYNITMNSDDSLPLENSPLMYGLKGENSDGYNQQLTAKDAVFTLLTFSNSITSDYSYNYEWMVDCYVDDGDPFSFHVIIDGNPLTIEKEYCIDFFKHIAIPILPEFFLNSTSNNVSYTEGGIKCWGLYSGLEDTTQWMAYSKSAFSCGKYMLYYYVEDSISVLQRNPNWFGVGAIDGESGIQPFVERVKIKCIPDLAEALKEFKRGKLDLMGVTVFPTERRLMQADARFEVQTQIGNKISYLAFNLMQPIIGGSNNYIYLNEHGKEEYTEALAIRKAICYAIDREEINQVEHDGEYLIYHEPFYWPSIRASIYDPWDSIKYNHDLDAAWEWMEAAGYQKSDSAKIDFFFSLLALLIITLSSTFVLKYKKRRDRKT
jgi:ABC-type transport system substrate-binding protein